MNAPFVRLAKHMQQIEVMNNMLAQAFKSKVPLSVVLDYARVCDYNSYPAFDTFFEAVEALVNKYKPEYSENWLLNQLRSTVPPPPATVPVNTDDWISVQRPQPKLSKAAAPKAVDQLKAAAPKAVASKPADPPKAVASKPVDQPKPADPPRPVAPTPADPPRPVAPTPADPPRPADAPNAPVKRKLFPAVTSSLPEEIVLDDGSTTDASEDEYPRRRVNKRLNDDDF
jgi:hypothetical protein